MESINCGWKNPEGFPDLTENQVHVWRIKISEFYNQANEFEQQLDAAEKKRARQYKFSDSRINFIICRGALRFLLSQYQKKNPLSIEIQKNTDGKPILAKKSRPLALEFNISHSDDICLIAISRNLEVGIDVEAVKPLTELEALAKTFLSERELTAFTAANPEKKRDMFYDIWSAKEALLKSVGCGLKVHPNQIDLEQVSGRKAFSVKDNSNLINISQIEMIQLKGLSGYVAWLAALGEIGKISTFIFSPDIFQHFQVHWPNSIESQRDG